MTFFFFRLQSSHWSVHFLETILKPPKAKSREGKLSQKGPHFLLFQGNLQNRTCLKVPFGFFWHCATFFRKFLNVPKGSPLRVFWYFATECMLINPEGFPFYIFRHYATFFERKKIQKFQFFFKMFCAFWALDMAPTLDVLLFLFETNFVFILFAIMKFHLMKLPQTSSRQN